MLTYPFLGKLGFYWNTLRYIKPKQFVGRFQRYFRSSKAQFGINGDKRMLINDWKNPALRAQRLLDINKFCFLNEFHYIKSVKDWNNPQYSKLWLYNLHYFDDLNAVDAEKRNEWHHELMQRWIADNPPGYGNGWEPYPISLRIINWVKWSMAGNELDEIFLKSMKTQIDWLKQNIETHLLGNHLFSNAKALCFAGLFFEGDEADKWYAKGIKLIEKEIPEQVLLDGGNFELSTMYHVIFLEDLLDLFNIHQVFDYKQPKGLEQQIPLMINWLENMCHPDGEISFFNDASLGMAPSVMELKNYASRFGFKQSNQNQLVRGIVDLPYSGYSRVETSGAVAIIDRAAIGPDYLPGHAHADTLSFELSLFGQRVIVNSGTSLYGVSKQRHLERSSISHATVVIDGENSSEVWDGFRVARRAKVSERIHSENNGIFKVSACHDGFKRLTGKPIHHREWVFEEQHLIVKDTISGKGSHNIDVVFPIHPDVIIKDKKNKNITLDVNGNFIKFTVGDATSIEIVASSYYPEFGVSQDNYQIVCKIQKLLPVEIITRIDW